MQQHYIRATKQDPMKPARPLSLKDLEYLHVVKFHGRSSVNQEEFDPFWAWFGTILYKVRNHQKHILPMWIKGWQILFSIYQSVFCVKVPFMCVFNLCAGLIYGFLSRDDSDRLMQSQSAVPGSFLIRFSDR